MYFKVKVASKGTLALGRHAMPIGIYGSIHASYFSETIAPGPVAFDVAHIERVAKDHESAGFDGVLVPFSATAPDNLLTVVPAAAATRKLRFLVSHRPGFVAPTVAARTLATLDQLIGGRLGVHLVAGSSDAEQHRDGDYLEHDQRFQRIEEYLTILQLIWSSDKPFDFNGQFYRFENAFSAVKPAQSHIPVSIGGASAPAVAAASRHADMFPIWAQDRDGVAALIGEARKYLAAGRKLRFGLSLRIVLGSTEDEAWAKAREFAKAAEEVQLWKNRGPVDADSVGFQRIRALTERAEVVDERLYTGLARATSAPGSVMALVGTPEQVADSLLRYSELGITDFLFRGLDPQRDASLFGKELIPLLRNRGSEIEPIISKTA